MVDNLIKRGPADRSRINVHEPNELEWWTKKWGVTATQLKIAVLRVGGVAEDVAKHLGKPLTSKKLKKSRK